jgi:CubicO group peptidase (beta-lactamase class C family)
VNGARILAPRTVEMMRTNHVNPDPLKTMPAGTGWGMDFNVDHGRGRGRRPYSNGVVTWYGIAGTWFWIDPVDDFAFVGMLQHKRSASRGSVHSLSHQLAYQAIVN